jgi:integrase
VPLTDIALRKATKRQILREGGLEFRFFEDGKAGVRFLGRVRGSNQRFAISLGRYPGLSLQAARKLGEAHRRLCEEGSDPRHARQEKAVQDQKLVGLLLDEYLGTLTDNRPRTVADKRSTLQTALKGLKDRPIKKVTKGDVTRLLDTYAQKPAVRRKLFSYLSHFLGWCQDRDLVGENVCRQIRAPKAVDPKERVLAEAEIAALMNVEGSLWGTMLKLVLLTGQRGGEVCKMRREELDLAAGVWTVPSATMKQGRSHRVPLSAAAIAILKGRLEKLDHGWGPYVFGAGSRGAKPYNGRSNGMEEVHRLTRTADWSGHDCRRTAITRMQKLGISREVRMRVTGHAQPRDGASSYEHYDFEKEAFAAVERLAAEIERIKRGALSERG